MTCSLCFHTVDDTDRQTEYCQEIIPTISNTIFPQSSVCTFNEIFIGLLVAVVLLLILLTVSVTVNLIILVKKSRYDKKDKPRQY